MGAVINGGFFVFEPEIFDYIDDNGTCCALEEAPLKNLAKDGELAVYLRGFWTAYDTYSDIININQLCNNGDSLWRHGSMGFWKDRNVFVTGCTGFWKLSY